MTVAIEKSAEQLDHAAVPFIDAFKFWLKLGFISFGGPAGQIAVMHDELVERRRWISEGRFLHALNYCMLLPGPEAQQLATYIGWLLHRTWGGVIAGVLFVLPSLSEGFGLPVVEAMACGLPVAASRRSSLPEVLGDAGLLFDPTSPDDIAAALTRLLDDPELRDRLRLRGLERSRHYSWERGARETMTVLEAAAAGRRARRPVLSTRRAPAGGRRQRSRTGPLACRAGRPRSRTRSRSTGPSPAGRRAHSLPTRAAASC